MAETDKVTAIIFILNIKLDLGEIGCSGVDRIILSYDRDQWEGSCERGNELSVFHIMLGYSWVAAQLTASREGLSSLELAT
jgi:hypothetical protein